MRVYGSSVKNIEYFYTFPQFSLHHFHVSPLFTTATAAACKSSKQWTVTALLTMHNLEQSCCTLYSHFPVIEYNLLMEKKGPHGRCKGDFPEAIIHISVIIRPKEERCAIIQQMVGRLSSSSSNNNIMRKTVSKAFL